MCYLDFATFPSDSQYFDFASLSYIQEKVKSRKHGYSCITVGDLNARFGEAVSELLEAFVLEQCLYPNVPDRIRTINDNASALLGICIDGNLLVLNNLKTRDKPFSK